jgi:DNA-binding LacI/PurR family transcriptional regulator
VSTTPGNGASQGTRARRQGAVTMRQVADAAGVSMQTVSNLLNGRSDHMAAETAQRIREVIEDLGYRRNFVARGLRSARAQALAFLVTDASARFLADPMTDLFLAGLGDELRDRDHGLLIQSAHPTAPFESLLAPVTDARVDGAVLFLSGPPELRAQRVERLRTLRIPTILLQEHGVHASEQPSVTAEDRSGSRALCRHLLERGHTRLHYLTASDSWSAIEERIAGFHEACAATTGDAVSGAITRRGTYAPLEAASVARDLLGSRERPTAMLCGNDLIALGVLKAARELGLRVPDDLAVAGFDDFDFAAALDPPLTTVRIPGYEMGRQAARSLLQAVDTGAPAESSTFPVEVYLRGST